MLQAATYCALRDEVVYGVWWYQIACGPKHKRYTWCKLIVVHAVRFVNGTRGYIASGARGTNLRWYT